MTKYLSKSQALLLQQYVDGQGDDQVAQQATQLMESSAIARVYVGALKSLGEAVRLAEAQAWQQAQVPPAADVVALATTSTALVEASLDELAPLLERFHDGEADPAEAAVVAGLVDERDDVAAYLSELDGMAAAIRAGHAVDDVDFGGFWEGISQAIDDSPPVAAVPDAASTAFDADTHALLIYRYYDGEVDDDERRLVEQWIAAGNEEVTQLLAGLDEVCLAVTAGIELAREQADMDQMWAGLSDGLDAVDAERAADNVVAFDQGDESRSSRTWNHPLVAMAAAVILLLTGALVGPELLRSSEEIVETRTVVIFDNVETAPGSSFHVSSPELAGHQVNAAEQDLMVSEDAQEPTVLWLIENEDDDDDDDDDDDIDEFPGPI